MTTTGNLKTARTLAMETLKKDRSASGFVRLTGKLENVEYKEVLDFFILKYQKTKQVSQDEAKKAVLELLKNFKIKEFLQFLTPAEKVKKNGENREVFGYSIYLNVVR
jgi:hypothetical protein